MRDASRRWDKFPSGISAEERRERSRDGLLDPYRILEG